MGDWTVIDDAEWAVDQSTVSSMSIRIGFQLEEVGRMFENILTSTLPPIIKTLEELNQVIERNNLDLENDDL